MKYFNCYIHLPLADSRWIVGVGFGNLYNSSTASGEGRSEHIARFFWTSLIFDIYFLRCNN